MDDLKDRPIPPLIAADGAPCICPREWMSMGKGDAYIGYLSFDPLCRFHFPPPKENSVGPDYLLTHDGRYYARTNGSSPLPSPMSPSASVQHVDLREQPYFPEEGRRKKSPSDVDIPGEIQKVVVERDGHRVTHHIHEGQSQDNRAQAVLAAATFANGRDYSKADLIDLAQTFERFIKEGR